MSPQKKLIEAERNKLDDSTARGLLLHCLFQAVGEGISMPELKRFINLQSPKSFSEFRLDEMLKDLVRHKFITLKKVKTLGGRQYRKYHIANEGLILLMAHSHLLPKEMKKANAIRFEEVSHIATAEIAKQEHYNGNVTNEITFENHES